MKSIFFCMILLSVPMYIKAQKDNISGKYKTSTKEIIARLTGYDYIYDTIRLGNRYSPENKNLCIKYLSSILENCCNKVSVQAYSATGNNIWGIIPSTTGSSEYVIIGAHYDAVQRSPGANDNATGVAAVYAVGDYISTLGHRQFNTIIVFFDEEERGILGSRAFAAMVRSDSLSVKSVHTIDQLGWDGDGDRAIELELPTEDLKELYLMVAKEGESEIPVHITRTPSTDHSAFRALGYNAVGITEEYINRDTSPHFHRSTDTFQTVNFEYLDSTISYLERIFKEIME